MLVYRFECGPSGTALNTLMFTNITTTPIKLETLVLAYTLRILQVYLQSKHLWEGK